MPFSIFRVRTVAGANITGALLGAVTFSNFFVLTLYVQQVLGLLGAEDRRHLRRPRPGSAVALGRRRAGARDASSAPKPVMAVGFVAWIAGMLWYTQIPVARLVRGRPAAGLPVRRLRAAVHVHPGLDRGARRCRGARGRARVGPDQHVAADRRRDRRRGRVVGLDQPLQPPARSRARRSRRPSRAARSGRSG